ncbi:unnamed protein product [Mycena citricolor]|uniref:Uncharacterized protein n=1 Tax=Mycena citricolor TaxID=2018698 RepID=A0AAD2HX75_9AGAR|nr:unnamed protein product [Mycena citricolor]CAK5283518.1 unnamed protein product [Mycena citricolor]
MAPGKPLHIGLPPRILRVVFGGAFLLLCFYVLVLRGWEWDDPSALPIPVIDDKSVQLGHPSFMDAWMYERALPQHAKTPVSAKWRGQNGVDGNDGRRYLLIRDASWGSGWNNIFQEQLLNDYLSYISDRSYVFPSFMPVDHPPYPNKLPDGSEHQVHIPMNALVSGPTAGGPLRRDESDPIGRRAVSVEYWHIACPPERVHHIKLYDMQKELGIDDDSQGDDRMLKWSRMLKALDAPCVSIDDGAVFNWMFIGGDKVMSIWPSYSLSPTMRNFAWSPMVVHALYRHYHLFSRSPAPTLVLPSGRQPYRMQSFKRLYTAEHTIPGLLAIHVRRGDYENHCSFLADVGADYNAWDGFGTPGLKLPPVRSELIGPGPYNYQDPKLPDYLSTPEGMSRRDAAHAHCWPSQHAIVKRARQVRAGTSTPGNMKSLFIATNGDKAWVAELAELLKADGWSHVTSSHDIDLTKEEIAISHAVDMAVMTAAQEFIGVGFSSMTSNVVQIRLGAGREANTCHFW